MKLHKTVLLKESIESLNIKPNGYYIDGTFGCGGHSKVILSKLSKEGKLIAFDYDPISVSLAKKIQDKRFQIFHSKFSSIKKYIKKFKLMGKIDGIILDLGISSAQLDDPTRGFSFRKNGPLDMRINNTTGKSAYEWLNSASLSEITNVLKNFGEERFYKRIAKNIYFQNKKKR